MCRNEPGSRISFNLRTLDHLGWIPGLIFVFDVFSEFFRFFSPKSRFSVFFEPRNTPRTILNNFGKNGFRRFPLIFAVKISFIRKKWKSRFFRKSNDFFRKNSGFSWKFKIFPEIKIFREKSRFSRKLQDFLMKIRDFSWKIGISSKTMLIWRVMTTGSIPCYAPRNFASDSINGVDFRKFCKTFVQNLRDKLVFHQKLCLFDELWPRGRFPVIKLEILHRTKKDGRFS